MKISYIYVSKEFFDTLTKEISPTSEISWVIDEEEYRESFLLKFEMNNKRYDFLLDKSTMDFLMKFYISALSIRDEVIVNLTNKKLTKKNNNEEKIY